MSKLSVRDKVREIIDNHDDKVISWAHAPYDPLTKMTIEKITDKTVTAILEVVGKMTIVGYITGYECGHNDTVESCYGCSEDKAKDYYGDIKEDLTWI